MPTPLRELLAYFDIDVDDRKLEAADEKVEGFIDKLKKFGEVVAEAFAIDKLKDFFGEQIEGAARLQDLSDKLGIAAHDLNDFQFAAKSVGIDSESAARSLGFLNRAIGEAVTGNKEAAQAFQKLGVHVKEGAQVRELADVLPDVADAFEKLKSQPEKAALAIKLFGRQGQALIPLLSQGREKLEEMRKEAAELGSGMGDEYPKEAKKAREEIEHFRYALDSLKQRLTMAALPAIEKLFEMLKHGAVDVIDFTKRTNVLQTGMAFLAAVASGKLVISLIKVAKSLGLIKGGILETVAAFMKFAGPTTILYGLYLILDDIYTWATGGQSVIGEALEKFEGAEAATALLKDLQGTIHELMSALGEISPSFRDIRHAAADTFPYIGRLIEGLVRGFLAFIHTLAAVAELVANLANVGNAGALKTLAADWMKRGHQIAVDLGIEKPTPEENSEKPPGPSEREGTATSRVNDVVAVAKQAHAAIAATAPPGAAAAAPVIPTPSGPATVVHMKQENHVEVHVDGGDKPQDTGRSAGQGAMTEIEKYSLRALSAIPAP